MSNKKVYLAKHVLASGFDVEYVKSHLSRIPGIQIIESGMGIKPRKCQAFVIVPHADCKHETGPEVRLSKNVYQDLEDFFENYKGDDDPADYVYVSGPFENALGNNVERTVPRAYYTTDDIIQEVVDKDDYDRYGYITVEVIEDYENDDEEEWDRDDCDLLYQLNGNIGNNNCDYLNVPRHHQPKPEYAMPPIPPVEERMIKQTTVNVTVEPFTPNCSLDRRLLLLRRK